MTTRAPIFSYERLREVLLSPPVRARISPPHYGEAASPEHLALRLASGVEAQSTQECWEWQRARDNYGYGALSVQNRRKRAHRLAYELGVGPIPKGLGVLHRCDNPCCINPAHLHVGTQADNMSECRERGRARGKPSMVRGLRNDASRLKPSEVMDIKALLKGGIPQRQVAEQYGISQSAISKLNLGETWRHITI